MKVSKETSAKHRDEHMSRTDFPRQPLSTESTLLK